MGAWPSRQRVAPSPTRWLILIRTTRWRWARPIRDTFAYEISGTDGTTDMATLTVTINGVNDAPVPIDNPRVDAATAGETYAFDLRPLFIDPEGDPVMLALVDTCDGFTVTSGTHLVGSQVFTGFDSGNVPSTTRAETKKCEVTASDGKGGTTPFKFDVIVDPVPRGGQQIQDFTEMVDLVEGAEVAEGTVVFPVSRRPYISPSGPAQYWKGTTQGRFGAGGVPYGTPISGTYGRFSMNVDGEYSYVPYAGASVNALDAGRSVSESFHARHTSRRIQGVSNQPQSRTTFTFRIHGLNDAPTLTATSGGFTYADADRDDVGFDNDGDSDDEGGMIEGRVGSSNPWTPGSNTAEGNKGARISGAYGSFFLQAGTGTSVAWSYEVDPNDPDTMALTTGQKVTETLTVRVDDVKTTPDTIQGVGGAISVSNGDYSSNAASRYSEEHVIDVQVTGAATPSINILPRLVADPTLPQAVIGMAYRHDLNDLFFDGDGDDLTFSALSCDGFALDGDDLVGGSSGAVSATATEGTRNCSVTANDGNGGATPAMFQVEVAEPLTAPSRVVELTLPEGIAGSGYRGLNINWPGTFVGVSSAVPYSEAAAAGLGEWQQGTYGRIRMAADKTFLYDVNRVGTEMPAGRVVNETFVYRVMDGKGSGEGTLDFHIHGLNDRPALTVVGADNCAGVHGWRENVEGGFPPCRPGCDGCRVRH